MAFRFNHLEETIRHHIALFEELNSSNPGVLDVQPSATYGEHPDVIRAAQDHFARLIA